MYLESLDPENNVEFNTLNLMYFVSVVIMRQLVIAVKYGLYSDDHLKLISEHKLSEAILTFDLIVNTTNNKAIDILWLRLGFRYDDLQISEDKHYFKLSEK